MFIVFSILLVMWFLGIHFYLPVPIIFLLFAATLWALSSALFNRRRQVEVR